MRLRYEALAIGPVVIRSNFAVGDWSKLPVERLSCKTTVKKMTFAGGFWNQRGVLTVHHNFSKINEKGIEKGNIYLKFSGNQLNLSHDASCRSKGFKIMSLTHVLIL